MAGSVWPRAMRWSGGGGWRPAPMRVSFILAPQFCSIAATLPAFPATMTDRSDFDVASHRMRFAIVTLFVIMLGATAFETFTWIRTPVSRGEAVLRLAPFYAMLVLAATSFIRQRVIRVIAAVASTAALLVYFVTR